MQQKCNKCAKNEEAIGTYLYGILIIITVALAWRYARVRQFDKHMRWAIHALILVNAVWFFGPYTMALYLGNQVLMLIPLI